MNLLIVLAWLAFSFLLWRGLRRYAVEEDRIFDLTFYATLAACVAARGGFVVTHQELFVGKSLILIPALWVTPGLSWLAALVGGTATFVLLSRRYKVRLGLVLDTLATSLPLPVILGLLGSFLGMGPFGKPTSFGLAFQAGEAAAPRHPVQLYEMVALVIINVIVYRLTTISTQHKWPYGLVGVWFFLAYALFEFALEFIKDSRVYWGSLSANQWVLIGIFAECIGVLYVRGGGREYFRPLFHTWVNFFEEKGKKMYESISQRHTH